MFLCGAGAIVLPAVMSGRFRLPTGPLGPIGFGLLMVLSLPGVLQAESLQHVLEFCMDVAFGALMLWCFYHLTREGVAIDSVLLKSALILTFVVAAGIVPVLITLDYAGNVCELQGTYDPLFIIYNQASMGLGLALFVPLAILLLPFTVKRGLMTGGAVLFSTVLMTETLFAGSRWGVQGASAVVAALLIPRPSRRFAIGSLAVLCLLACSGVIVSLSTDDNDLCLRRMGTDRLLYMVSPSVYEAVHEKFSWFKLVKLKKRHKVGNIDDGFYSRLMVGTTGRMEGFIKANELIVERPLLGHGLGRVHVPTVNREYGRIHNVFLRYSASNGLVWAIWLSVMVATPLLAGLRLGVFRPTGNRRQNLLLIAVTAVVAVGLILSLATPMAVFGAFQLNAVWWVSAGVLAGLHKVANPGSEWATSFRWPFLLRLESR